MNSSVRFYCIFLLVRVRVPGKHRMTLYQDSVVEQHTAIYLVMFVLAPYAHDDAHRYSTEHHGNLLVILLIV